MYGPHEQHVAHRLELEEANLHAALGWAGRHDPCWACASPSRCGRTGKCDGASGRASSTSTVCSRSTSTSRRTCGRGRSPRPRRWAANAGEARLTIPRAVEAVAAQRALGDERGLAEALAALGLALGNQGELDDADRSLVRGAGRGPSPRRPPGHRPPARPRRLRRRSSRRSRPRGRDQPRGARRDGSARQPARRGHGAPPPGDLDAAPRRPRARPRPSATAPSRSGRTSTIRQRSPTSTRRSPTSLASPGTWPAPCASTTRRSSSCRRSATVAARRPRTRTWRRSPRCAASTDAPPSCSSDGLALRHELGDEAGLAEVLEGLAGVSSAGGRDEDAATFLAAASSVRERTGSTASPAETDAAARLLASARRRLGPERFDAGVARGRAMSLPRSSTSPSPASPPALADDGAQRSHHSRLEAPHARDDTASAQVDTPSHVIHGIDALPRSGSSSEQGCRCRTIVARPTSRSPFESLLDDTATVIPASARGHLAGGPTPGNYCDISSLCQAAPRRRARPSGCTCSGRCASSPPTGRRRSPVPTRSGSSATSRCTHASPIGVKPWPTRCGPMPRPRRRGGRCPTRCTGCGRTLASRWLDAVGDTIALAGDDRLWVDVWDFDRLAAGGVRGRSGRPRSRSTPPTCCPALYDDWALGPRVARQAALIAALEAVVAADESAGDLQRALTAARRLIVAAPLHESAHQTYLRLLGRLRRFGEAATHLEQLHELFVAELGVAPMAETTSDRGADARRARPPRPTSTSDRRSSAGRPNGARP